MAQRHIRIHEQNEEYLRTLMERTPFLSTYNDTVNYVITLARRHKLT